MYPSPVTCTYIYMYAWTFQYDTQHPTGTGFDLSYQAIHFSKVDASPKDARVGQLGINAYINAFLENPFLPYPKYTRYMGILNSAI